MGAPDQPLQQVLPLWTWGQCAGPTGVPSHGGLDHLEDLGGDKRLVDAGQTLTPMPDHARVEDVVEDDPDRCRGEQPGLGYKIALGVGKFLCIPGPEAFIFVEPSGQGRQRSGPGGVVLEQLRYSCSLFRIDVDAARMLGLTLEYPRLFRRYSLVGLACRVSERPEFFLRIS